MCKQLDYDMCKALQQASHYQLAGFTHGDIYQLAHNYQGTLGAGVWFARPSTDMRGNHERLGTVYGGMHRRNG